MHFRVVSLLVACPCYWLRDVRHIEEPVYKEGWMKKAIVITVCLGAFLAGASIAGPILVPFSCSGTAWCSGRLASGYVPGPPDIYVSDCMSTGGAWSICTSTSSGLVRSTEVLTHLVSATVLCWPQSVWRIITIASIGHNRSYFCGRW